jgi:hypothetical protein
MTTIRRIAQFLILVLVLLPVSAISDDSTAVNDGPYITIGDSVTLVTYLCQGERIERAFEGNDTIRFMGLCADSLLSYSIPTEPPAVGPHSFESVSKWFAVSDIHGEYEHFCNLLMGAGIVDSSLNWQWGDGHLVVVGDVFDRGSKVTETFWLIYLLQQQAQSQGGRVHLTLGNHEIMPLQKDLRYIHTNYSDAVVPKLGIEYDALFGPGTVLGDWLRVRHTAIKLNDILFVHAGLSLDVIRKGYTLEQINNTVRDNIDTPRDSIKADSTLSLLFRSSGPLWYRGLVTDYNCPLNTLEEIDEILDTYGAASIVVGHSEVDTLTSLSDGRVYAIDIDVAAYKCLHGLLWEDGVFYRVMDAGRRARINP